MTDVALKEYLEGQIEALRRELSVQRESDQRLQRRDFALKSVRFMRDFRVQKQRRRIMRR